MSDSLRPHESQHARPPRCDGHIAEAPSGDGGFGYDPLFIPDGHDRSFAELAPAEKNAISHRGRALAALRAELSQLANWPTNQLDN